MSVTIIRDEHGTVDTQAMALERLGSITGFEPGKPMDAEQFVAIWTDGWNQSMETATYIEERINRDDLTEDAPQNGRGLFSHAG
ncbi:hypothetical protein BISA_1356 [Bifidobacterium saguini DSM 23967]|uniref:Uncharacterized protein n=1 Tax=Bifidobacterium saguini DSM 23967 TaxID=1437607 RepID=A0A087DCE1_9BIFI|nr:hypothetical protein [Bifidobacterium saguini]KFI93191.1 hypothetical protein BISA_1356 [Bifidobacterium saguini DSM 23967]